MRKAQLLGEKFPARELAPRRVDMAAALSRARRCRSRARNTDSPVADQPAAARIAERSASSPAPVLAETAIAPGGGSNCGARSALL